MDEPVGTIESQLVGGVPLRVSSPTDAAHELCRLATQRRRSGVHVHLVNAYTIALADGDPTYASLLAGGGLNFPDGKPIAVLSGLRRQHPRLQQIRGPRLFLDVFDLGRQYGLKHYLLGSSPEVLAKLEKALLQMFPGCEIVGSESPPYRPLTKTESEAQDERIMRQGPHIVWVGLGTPKQDFEARRLAESTGLTAVAVGAAFDFTAGTTREAPGWMTAAGVEWLFRLGTEPRRLWKRYLFGNIAFLRIVLRRRK